MILALDQVPQTVNEWMLKKPGMNERLVMAVMWLYDGEQTKVKVGNGMSDRLPFEVGIHQVSVCIK